MKATIKNFVIFLLFGIFSSCEKDETLIGDYFSSLYYQIEDESGKDLLQDLDFYLGNGIFPDIPYMGFSSIYETGRESSITREVPNYNESTKFYMFREVALRPNKLTMRLFDDDVENIELYGFPIKYNGHKEFEWEFKGEKIQMSESGKTYVTIVRHDDGSYSLK